MGRPLNKKFFGDPANDGSQFSGILANVSGTNTGAGWKIVSQRSNSAYMLEHTTGSRGVAKLVDKTGSLLAGEMAILVSPFLGGTETVRILNAHHVKTFQGNVYKWVSDDVGATSFDEAEIAMD